MSSSTRCPRCGREEAAGAAFCLECGAALRPGDAAPGCPACGGPLQPGARFCARCGAPQGAQPSGPPPLPPSSQPSLPPPLPPPTPLPPGTAPRAAARGGPMRLGAVRTDGLPGATYALEGTEAICGRSEGSVRVADDPTVSPRHARFTLRDGVLAVEDLGSLNGTFLRIRTPRRLAVGAEIRVGKQLLRLEPHAVPSAAAADRPPGAPEPERFRLSQLLEGGGLGEVFPLAEGENAIGREVGRVTFPSDRYVSSRHARIDVKGDAVTLTDLGSSNGTFVRLAGPAELVAGDQLLVGAQLLRVDA